MKQLSIIVNIVLVLAVGILYFLHFNSPKAEASEETAENGTMSDLKIAYINADTVLKHYEYFKVSRDKLETKGKKMDTDFRNRAQGLQREITNYQNSVSTLTIGQAKAIEEDLTKKQQNLRMYQESLAQELAVEENKLNQELYEKITTYLKSYGTQNGIHAVFKFDPSSDLLFAGEAMNITNEIIAGLNDEYKQSQNTTSPSDSTKTK